MSALHSLGQTSIERHTSRSHLVTDSSQAAVAAKANLVGDIANKILMAAARMDDPVKYITVKINNCARKGHHWLAQAIFDGAKKCNITPNIVTFNALIKAYVYGNRVSKALEILNFLDSDQSQIKPDLTTYNTLIHGCAITKNANGAFYLIRRMKSAGLEPNVWTFTSLLYACLKSEIPSKVEEARQLMQEAGIYPNAVTFNTLMNDLVENGNLEDAVDLLGSMASCQVVPDDYTFTILSKGYRAPSQLEQVFPLLEKMESIGFLPGLVTIASLMDICLQLEKPAKAIALFIAFDTDEDIPKDPVYGHAIKAYIKLGVPEKAQALLSKIGAKGARLERETYLKVLMSCKEARDANLAFDLYTEMREAGISFDRTSLLRVIEVCHKANQNVKKIMVRSYYNSVFGKAH